MDENKSKWTSSSKVEAEGLEWLYNDPTQQQQNSLESYLLGESIPGARGELRRTDELDEKSVGSLLTESSRVFEQTLNKFREDPLFIIKKLETQQQQIINKYSHLQKQRKIRERDLHNDRNRGTHRDLNRDRERDKVRDPHRDLHRNRERELLQRDTHRDTHRDREKYSSKRRSSRRSRSYSPHRKSHKYHKYNPRPHSPNDKSDHKSHSPSDKSDRKSHSPGSRSRSFSPKSVKSGKSVKSTKSLSPVVIKGPKRPRRYDPMKYAFGVNDDICPPDEILETAKRKEEMERRKSTELIAAKCTDESTAERLNEMIQEGQLHIKDKINKLSQFPRSDNITDLTTELTTELTVDGTVDNMKKEEYLMSIKKKAFETTNLSNILKHKSTKHI